MPTANMTKMADHGPQMFYQNVWFNSRCILSEKFLKTFSCRLSSATLECFFVCYKMWVIWTVVEDCQPGYLELFWPSIRLSGGSDFLIQSLRISNSGCLLSSPCVKKIGTPFRDLSFWDTVDNSDRMCPAGSILKEHIALDRSSWFLKSVLWPFITKCI